MDPDTYFDVKFLFFYCEQIIYRICYVNLYLTFSIEAINFHKNKH
jgi:hypothetical protein